MHLWGSILSLRKCFQSSLIPTRYHQGQLFYITRYLDNKNYNLLWFWYFDAKRLLLSWFKNRFLNLVFLIMSEILFSWTSISIAPPELENPSSKSQPSIMHYIPSVNVYNCMKEAWYARDLENEHLLICMDWVIALINPPINLILLKFSCDS